MMNKSVVSIIVPIYNVEQYITRCVVALVCQSYANIEIIFVDDCTPDSSIEIVKETLKSFDFKGSYKIIKHDVNRGLAAARNTGVKSATGKYIMHVDSDDWIEPTMVECMVDAAEKTNSDIAICGVNIVQKEGIRRSFPKELDKDQLIIDILLKALPGSMWGKLISREIYEKHEDVWSIEGINHGEDYATMPRLLFYASKICYVNKPLYNYNQLNLSSYTNNFSAKSMHSMMHADAVLSDFFSDKLNEDIIYRMKLRSKTGMIKRCNPDLYPELNKLYKDIPIQYIKSLPLIDRMSIRMVGKGFDRILARLIRMGLKIQRMIK